ncbi:hypothetical protein C0992_005952 [Termitomyces sp. T32_za158]|nr:hypothetical protein C0992_005952 [Termitomyces sp. T32_za158]
MERSSSPLSDRSYAEAVTGSPARRPSTKRDDDPDQMQLDSPQPSSPEFPLSSMPIVSTQDQMLIEESAIMTGPMNIEVDNTLGLASDDVNALLQNSNAQEGWQTVTPRKSRKKTKKGTNKRQETNKRPHSDSPIKERTTKRQATESGTDASGDEGEYRRTHSPSPAASVANQTLPPMESPIRAKKGNKRASITPRAADRAQTTAAPTTAARETPPAPRDPPTRTGPPRTTQNAFPTGIQSAPIGDQRGSSPMKISTPNPGHQGDHDPEDLDENDPELWFETLEGDIITNGKGFRRTATPPGGWPRVYLAANPTYNIATETLNEWEDITAPTIWARIYRARYEPTEIGKTRVGDMIKKVITNLVYIEHDENLAVIFPDQDLPPGGENRYPHPHHLLVVGLEPQQAQRLLDLEVVASTEATIFFLPRYPPRHLYILTMSGLTYNNTRGAQELVEELARKTFRTSPEIRAIIESHTELPAEEALDDILDIRASFLPVKQRTNTIRCWNLYFRNDPGLDEEDYKLLRRKMRACTFKTLTFGKGHALTGENEQPMCTGCKSADHDSFNCPFSRLPGWLGYRPAGPGDTAGTTDFIDDRQNKQYHNNPYGRTRGRGYPRRRGGYGYRGRGTGHSQRGRGRA